MISEVYLLSSLPSLSFGNKPPITLEEFEHTAKMELPEKDIAVLDEVSIRLDECGAGSVLSTKVCSILRELQEDISMIRRSKNENQDPKTNLLPGSVLVENPLNSEIIAMKWLWEQIEEIESGRTFTMHEVVAYKLKLQILQRLYSFNKEKGKAILDSLLEASERSIAQ